MMLTLKDIRDLAALIKRSGGTLFLVGGYPRDLLLGKESKDFDCEVYDLSAEGLKSRLEDFCLVKKVKLNCVGEAFQVYKLDLNVDVVLPRKDHKSGTGHKGFIVEGDPKLSTLEASRRRDCTINAMMLDPLTGKIVDHFGGQEDIKNKLIKMVDSSTFVEDPLRALRAVQFASRFGFTIEAETTKVIKGMDLSSLPRERVWMEFDKLMMKSPKPSVGLFAMQEMGINEKLFPELHVLEGVLQGEEHHPEGNVMIHSFYAADVAKTVVEDLPYAKQVTVVLAALFHDLGKFECTRVFFEHADGSECDKPEVCASVGVDLVKERITAHGHAEAGVSLARNMLDRFNLHSIDGYDVRGQVLALVEYHMHPIQFSREKDMVKDSAFRRLSTKVDLDLLQRVFHADAMSRNFNSLGRVFTTEASDWFREKITNLEIKPEGPERILKGRHLIELGVKPGKEMGKILDEIFELQLDGQVMTLEQAIETAKLSLNIKKEKENVA